MGDSGFADTSPLPQLPAAGIHLNKDFIRSDKRTQQWTDFYSGPMYNNSTPQYPPPGYENSYPYQYGANYGYQGYGYQNQPVPPGDTYTHQSGGGWTQQGGYSTTAQQHQQAEPKMEVVQEMQQQKATLTKQREDYVRKALVLRRELDQLKQQKQELASDERSEKDLRSVLKENDRLQDEINSKLKAIMNVIEMLSSIIKDGKKLPDLEADLQKPKEEPKSEKTDDSATQSPKMDNAKQRGFNKDPRIEKSDRDSYKKERFSYVYYDTGLHWCRSCDKFPETAKDFLQHLHAEEHQEKAKENEVDTTPWHKLPVEPLLPSYDDAPKKRIPIKGLQFFISAPSWYCKLCDVWIGDLHCASHHLKSQAHFHNYENFVNENPQWETQWLKDRELARARNEKKEGESSDSDSHKKKKKRRRRSSNESLMKDKKKKKRSKKKKKRKKADSSDSSSSSSSSSDSSSDDEDGEQKEDQDTGKSIRVAMRNMQQVKSIMDEDMTKWSVLEKLMGDMKKPEQPDETINQWMTVAQPVPDKEKNLLDSLKDRMKAKHDLEKARMAELDLRRREKEREDQEQERKRRQAREDAERAERDRKRKEEDMNKVLDKDRSHIRFRPRDQHSRRRRSKSAEQDRRDRSHHRDSREREREREREQSPQFKPRRDYKPSPEKDFDESSGKKKPPGPPSYKKLPFIGRMPLFKKKSNKPEERREIEKAAYEPVRKTRFESGMLARAFIPRPDVVCFPVLSSIPPMMAPPEPTAVEQTVMPEMVAAPPPPKAPKIRKEEVAPPPPPPPENDHNDVMLQHQVMESEYYQNMYEPSQYDVSQYDPSQYDTSQYDPSQYEAAMPHPPLEPPPLPPDDDLAMLGICADDMAAQTF